jgi:hypothetical protein
LEVQHIACPLLARSILSRILVHALVRVQIYQLVSVKLQTSTYPGPGSPDGLGEVREGLEFLPPFCFSTGDSI